MLEHFYSKHYKVEILHFTPRYLHRTMRIFHCWKQCCKSSSDSLFMRCVTFAFIAYMDLNLVPFNADLIFGNKQKCHWPRSGEYRGCSNKVILCLVKKSLHTRRCVPARCLCEKPISPCSTFHVFFFSPIEGLSKPRCTRYR